jgi:serine/threonine protein kinase
VPALKYLHDNQIVHRDLKLANILLHFPNSDLVGMTKEERKSFLRKVDLTKEVFLVKIADFGFATRINTRESNMESILGTPLYMAPQLFNEEPYTYKVDIWAIGVILFEMITGNPPF